MYVHMISRPAATRKRHHSQMGRTFRYRESTGLIWEFGAIFFTMARKSNARHELYVYCIHHQPRLTTSFRRRRNFAIQGAIMADSSIPSKVGPQYSSYSIEYVLQDALIQNLEKHMDKGCILCSYIESCICSYQGNLLVEVSLPATVTATQLVY